MTSSVLPLDEVVNLTPEQAKELFIVPTKYDHLGIDINPQPKKIKLKNIRTSDINNLNFGRPNGHSPKEKEQLKISFSRGVQPWQELPFVSHNNDNELIKNGLTHDLRLGFGRTNAIGENGKDEYWFWEVNGTPTQLKDLQSFENTCKLLEVEFQTGEQGIVDHLNNLLDSGPLSDDEEEIEKKLLQVWPGLENPSKGRIMQKVLKDSTTPKRYRTYNQTDVGTWIAQEAAPKIWNNLSIRGNYDCQRDMFGFSSVNIQDPYISAITKYNESLRLSSDGIGKKSYVVLSCKSPTKNSDLQKKRHNLVKSLHQFHMKFYKYFNVEKDSPLVIMGFLPQDTKNEDPRFLVDKNGKRLDIEI